MDINFQDLATTELKLTGNQLKTILEDAVLKQMPEYTKAEVRFNVETAYGYRDEIIGHELKSVTVSLSKRTN
jgi:hypothetical protein